MGGQGARQALKVPDGEGWAQGAQLAAAGLSPRPRPTTVVFVMLDHDLLSHVRHSDYAQPHHRLRVLEKPVLNHLEIPSLTTNNDLNKPSNEDNHNQTSKLFWKDTSTQSKSKLYWS